jgi:hypothetical protein
MYNQIKSFFSSNFKDWLKKTIPFKIRQQLFGLSSKTLAEQLLARYGRYLKNSLQNDDDQRLLRASAYETNSYILDVAHAKAVLHYGAYIKKTHGIDKESGLLNLSNSDYAEANKSLTNSGYWVAPHKIDEALLEQYAKSSIARLETLKQICLDLNDLKNLPSLTFTDDMVFLGADWVMAQELAIRLATSEEVYEIVAEYLGVNPVLNLPESWFSFPVNKINKQSAQNWHWDCDRIKWIKVFVYINDVSQNNGPHAYIAGSHRGWRVRTETSRVSREELMIKYKPEDEVVFVAPKGTVIFEDTRGFHRGTPLLCGCRLVLQLEFSIDSFGYIHNKISVPEQYHAEFSCYPRLGQNLLFV